MSGKYLLRVETDFAAAHTLRDYPGDCNRMHGHNWKVVAEVEARQLDAVGMGIDFRDLKRALRDIARRLDHRYLNDIPPFDRHNPTAEHLARYFHEALSEALRDRPVRVHAVTLWETERAAVRYSRDD